jgi:hypothetical protein
LSARATLPAGVLWAEEPRTPSLGVAYSVWEALYGVQIAEQAAPDEITLVEGVASLATSAQARLLPQIADTPDELDRIDLSTVGQGRVVRLSCGTFTDESGSAAITIRHRAGGIINSGEFVLADEADIVLQDPAEWLMVQRIGSQFWQIRPIGSGRISRLSQNLDMQGYAAFGGSYFVDSHASSARTITTDDRGKELVNTVSCVYTLPMAQPASSALQWAVGDFVLFRQEGPACSFRTSLGSTPRNLDNHDRGRGVGSKMECELIRVSPTFLWALVGQTQSAGSGPAPVERVYAHVASASTITTDAASTAWKNAQALVHTPGSNERWLYLAHCGFKSSNSQSNTGAELRFQRAEITGGPQLGCPRYTAHQDAPLLMTAAAYGVSPGSQTLNIDVKVGNGTYAASVFSPAIIGIRLASDEFLSQAAGSANNVTNTTYVDLITMTETFAADDYYFFVWGDYGSVNTLGVTVAVEVDGVLRHEKAIGRNTGLNGYFGFVIPATFTSGSKTIKLKVKGNGAYNSTIQNMGICALRKANFNDVAAANSPTGVTTTATAYQDFTTVSKSLTSGWDYLVLADLDTKLDVEGSSPSVKAQMVRNGTRVGSESRTVPRAANEYAPVTFGAMAVLVKSLEEDTFALQYASGRTTDTADVKEGTVLVLALAPTA